MENPLTNNGNSQERMMATIACIPPLFWMPIVLEKKTPYVADFMKHGFGILLVGVTLNLLSMFLWLFILFLLPLIWLIRVVMMLIVIYLAYHAYMGKKVVIPYFTEHLDTVIGMFGIKSWFEPK